MTEKSEKKESLMGKLRAFTNDVNLAEVEMKPRTTKSAPAAMVDHWDKQSVVMNENK
jgi:hypothetical protein